MLDIEKMRTAPQTLIDNHWVMARPLKGPFLSRLRDAWKVLIGKADAIMFYKQ